jgi:type I restriction enzyme R subunit
VGHFDLIVIDEAHRSVYQKYRAIFEYFDSPAGGPDRHAQGRDRPQHLRPVRPGDGVPTDAYGLDEAVADGYLVPPVAISVPLKFQREGIKYDDLSEDGEGAVGRAGVDEDGTTPTRWTPRP